MDDFGNELHWTVTVHGWHSLGLYGYSEYVVGGPLESIDFGELPCMH